MSKIAFLAALLFSSSAFAAPCPWTKIESVSATTTTLFINGIAYNVTGRSVSKQTTTDVTSVGAITVGSTNTIVTKGDRNWMKVYAILDACGDHTAAEDLKRWRASRRSFNWSILGMSCTYGLTAPWTVTSGILAVSYRRKLVDDLRDGVQDQP